MNGQYRNAGAKSEKHLCPLRTWVIHGNNVRNHKKTRMKQMNMQHAACIQDGYKGTNLECKRINGEKINEQIWIVSWIKPWSSLRRGHWIRKKNNEEMVQKRPAIHRPATHPTYWFVVQHWRQILVSSLKGKVIARQRCLSVDSRGYVLAMLAYEKTDWFSLIFSIEYLKCGDMRWPCKTEGDFFLWHREHAHLEKLTGKRPTVGSALVCPSTGAEG